MMDEYRFYHNQPLDSCMVYQMYEHVGVSCDRNYWRNFFHNIDIEMVVHWKRSQLEVEERGMNEPCMYSFMNFQIF